MGVHYPHKQNFLDYRSLWSRVTCPVTQCHSKQSQQAGRKINR